jgi:hypothetical protein
MRWQRAAQPRGLGRITLEGLGIAADGDTITDGTVTWQQLSNPFAALAVGLDSVTVKYEVTADELNTAATVSIIPSSDLRLLRRENGA